MNSVGIILAAGLGKRLERLKTSKPLTLVYGRPLISHKIEYLEKAGVKEIFILAGNNENSINSFLVSTKEVSIPVSFVENLTDALSQERDGCFITACDLFFEENPYKFFPKKANIELLVDKHLEHNKFSGADYKAKTSWGKLVDIGSNLETSNALLPGIVWFSRGAFDDLRGARFSLDNENLMDELFLSLVEKSKIKIINMPKMLWYDVNTPETLMRAEMLLRRKYSGRRPSRVKVENLKPIEQSLGFFYQKSKTTPVVIKRGLLNELSEIKLMEPERAASHHIIITDPIVDKLYGDLVFKQLEGAGYTVTKLICPVREAAKTMEVYHDFAEKIVALGVDDQSIIFSLGGGAVANLAGFLASTIHRGIGLIHIPTTLMCMSDVAISLKQGINSQKGKNLVGSYYQPLLVLIDPGIKMTDSNIRHGLSEPIKHALGQDREFFNFLLNYNGPLDDVDFIEKVIRRTIELKIELMNEDMFENSRGIILNYGHEVGHAMEYLSGFKLSHGEGICIGMRVSAELSNLMNVANEETVLAHKTIFRHYKLPYAIPENIKKEDVIEALRFNKKTRGQDVRFALLENIGTIWKIKGEFGIPCPIEIIEQAVARGYKI